MYDSVHQKKKKKKKRLEMSVLEFIKRKKGKKKNGKKNVASPKSIPPTEREEELSAHPV